MAGKVDLTFIIQGARDKDSHELSNIPLPVWEAFQSRAREAMPERGADAWVAFLAEFIALGTDADSRSLVMTEIPRSAYANLERACAQADVTVDQLFAVIIHGAGTGDLHLVHYLQPTKDPQQLVLLNVPPHVWDTMAKLRKKFSDQLPDDHPIHKWGNSEFFAYFLQLLDSAKVGAEIEAGNDIAVSRR